MVKVEVIVYSISDSAMLSIYVIGPATRDFLLEQIECSKMLEVQKRLTKEIVELCDIVEGCGINVVEIAGTKVGCIKIHKLKVWKNK